MLQVDAQNLLGIVNRSSHRLPINGLSKGTFLVLLASTNHYFGGMGSSGGKLICGRDLEDAHPRGLDALTEMVSVF